MDVFGCLEPGCDAPADAEAPQIIGRDDQGNIVWMRRATCCLGHRYMVEDFDVATSETG